MVHAGKQQSHRTNTVPYMNDTEQVSKVTQPTTCHTKFFSCMRGDLYRAKARTIPEMRTTLATCRW